MIFGFIDFERITLHMTTIKEETPRNLPPPPTAPRTLLVKVRMVLGNSEDYLDWFFLDTRRRTYDTKII